MAKSLHTREAGCLYIMDLQLFMLEHTSPPELLCRNKANENGFAQTGRDTGHTAEVIGSGTSWIRAGAVSSSCEGWSGSLSESANPVKMRMKYFRTWYTARHKCKICEICDLCNSLFLNYWIYEICNRYEICKY